MRLGEAAEIFMNLATGSAALFALWTYRRSAALERAKWIKELYEKFYERPDLKEIRDTLDAQDPSEVLRLVQEEGAAFTDYLNFFEFLGYLVSSRQISRQEVVDLFEYYIRRIEENPPVLAYVNDPSKGYEKLQRLLRMTTISRFLFVYGTLMRGFDSLPDWQSRFKARHLGSATIAGRLYDLGEYPGALLPAESDSSKIVGELYELHDPESAVAALDAYEEFFPLQPDKSLFLRTLIAATLSDGRIVNAWVYLYSRSVDESQRIRSGAYKPSRAR
jgi:gamma-glutamylcyclotransferase (GGCT)/AIG2-like uncharacterized protein YtfP